MALNQTPCTETNASCYHRVSLQNEKNRFLVGNVINGEIMYPVSAILVAVWDNLAKSLNVPKEELSVEFKDIVIYAQPVLNEETQLTLSLEIQGNTGCFKVINEGITLASGYVTESNNIEMTDIETINFNEMMNLNAADIYSLLRERNYAYSEQFRSIEHASTCLTKAELTWCDNWVTFIDSILQLNVLRQAHSTISQLTQIERICIDVKKHREAINAVSNSKVLLGAAISDKFTRCGGVLIEDIKFRPGRTENKVELQALQFIENGQTNVDTTTSLMVFLQIVAENINLDALKIVGLTKNHLQGTIFTTIQNMSSNVYGINIHYEQIDLQSYFKNRNAFQEADILIVYNLSTDNDVCQQLHHLYASNKYIITEEDHISGNRVRPTSLYKVVSTLSGERTRLQLARWRPTPSPPIATAITIRTPFDYTLLRSARATMPSRHRLLVFSPYPAPSGLKNLVQTWRQDVDKNSIQLVMINSESNNFFVDELPDIDLAFNVVDQCKWGGEYFVPIYNSIQGSNMSSIDINEPGTLHERDAGSHTSTTSRIFCDPDLCQLVLFNDETFGLQLVGKLIERGAKKLHILYNARLTTKFQFKARLWHRNGVAIQLSSNKLTTENDVINIINDTKKLGNLQGIYAVIGDEQDIPESLFTYLDTVSRKLCPELRYFAILNSSEDITGHQVCVSRVRSKLPATMLCLSELRNPANINWGETLDAIEHALLASETVLTVRAIRDEKPTVPKHTTSLDCISNPNHVLTTIPLDEITVKV